MGADAERRRARARALVWMIVAESLGLVTLTSRWLYWDAAASASSDVLELAIDVLAAATTASWLGAAASWAAADGRPLARAALGLASMSVISALVLSAIYPLWGHALDPDTMELVSMLAWVPSRVGAILVMVSVASTSGGTVVWTLGAVGASLRLGRLVFDAAGGVSSEVASRLNIALAVAGTLAFVVLAALVRARPERRPAPAPAFESWGVAMRGLRAVRQAEIARVALVAAGLALLVLAMLGRSPTLAIFIALAMAVGVILVALATLVGLARARHVPLASDARGPLRAAFALSLASFAGGVLASSIALWLALGRPPSDLGPRSFDALAIDVAALGVGSTIALLVGLRRVARTLQATGAAARATVAAIGAGLGGSALSVLRLPIVAHAGSGLVIALTVLAVGATVVGLVAFLGALARIEGALAACERASAAEPFA